MKGLTSLFTFLFLFIHLSTASLLTSTMEKMIETGFIEIFLFILFSALFYAALSKSGIFGENKILLSVVAVSMSFLIFVFPVITGFKLIETSSRFFTQIFTIVLIFVFSIVIAGIFYPDIIGTLASSLKGPTLVWVLIPLVLALVITSGFISVFWAGMRGAGGVSTDAIILVVGIIIFIVVLLIGVSIGRGK